MTTSVFRTDLSALVAGCTDADGVTDATLLAERMPHRMSKADSGASSARDSYRRWSVNAWKGSDVRAIESACDPHADARRLDHETNTFYAADHMPGARSDTADEVSPRDKLNREIGDLWRETAPANHDR